MRTPDIPLARGRAVGAPSGVRPIENQLIEDIRAGNCVAFVGAGFSAAAGLPSWHTLLKTMAAELVRDGATEATSAIETLLSTRTSVSSHEFEVAGQLLFDQLAEGRCRELLRRALRPQGLPEAMQTRLKHLLGIPFRAIVTTNFDPILAGVAPGPEAYRRLLRAPQPSPWREAIAEAALGKHIGKAGWDAIDRPIIQLHGTLDDDETMVFTRAQYRRRLYANPAYLTVLRALFATSSVLFLGYSLKDAYLNELRAELVEALQGEPQRGQGRSPSAEKPLAWAVLEDVSDVAHDYYEKHEGLGVLGYATKNGGADHSGFDALLKQLYAETNPVHRLGQHLKGRRIFWFDPNKDNNHLGRELLSKALKEVEGVRAGDGVRDLLVDVKDLGVAKGHLESAEPFHLVITHWGHGKGPGGSPNGAALLRAAAKRRAEGHGVAPIIVFAGKDHADENRVQALALGAFEFTCEWPALMAAIERALNGAGPTV